MCTPRYAFGGGQLWLVQYIANDLDHNHMCGEPMSVTILTRTISSAMAVASAAVLVPAPEPSPAPAPVVEVATVAAVPPELTHLGGTGLVTLPVRTESATHADGCAVTSPASARGESAPRVGGDADRPRHRHTSRRRHAA